MAKCSIGILSKWLFAQLVDVGWVKRQRNPTKKLYLLLLGYPAGSKLPTSTQPTVRLSVKTLL
ncbi:MAG: hypothetical protein F6K22_04530 [Okeania sp. SIO2F4]|uniref:hypothetical protein n=1 Tax=Okeania sp. SIO2F4 TaxID=2607790 RepID=UPI00142A5776|nr:hypothetical protein [Okeania sp. SIO2F4]NES02163.1 hypothetical protein [Okeania sp. SIO2F4]